MIHSRTPSTPIILELKKIRKSFGTKHVHRGVNLALHEGEILGLFGGSGTGKSVILRSIIGLDQPDEGEIRFEGKNILDRDERQWISTRTKISYVFQNGALFDSLTVEENLSYPLREHTKMGDRAILKKVNEMLELIDMKGSNLLYPNELSGWDAKTRRPARATILNPQIILFDEPTAGLDPVNTKRLVNNIRKLKERNITGILLVMIFPVLLKFRTGLPSSTRGSSTRSTRWKY